MLDGLVGPAVANTRDERADLQAAFEADGNTGALQPWDWAFTPTGSSAPDSTSTLRPSARISSWKASW
ncbi:hypothetical protein BH24ACT9_BH24ACT9_12970 [soil metagenome]